MGLEEYLRWLGRGILKIPQGLKNSAAEIPKFLRKPKTEWVVGFYSLSFGILAVLLNTLCSPFYPFWLSTIQCGLVILIGFFLFTHGIYRVEKEAEYKVLFPEEAEG